MARPRKVIEETELSTEDLLKKQIEELTKKLEAVMEKQSQNQDEEIEYDFDDIEIKPSEYIKVMSLCPMEMNLSTQGMGKGKHFKFNKFGDIKRILYSDLVDIMEVHSNFLNGGYFYIVDKRVVRKHGLDELYANLLTKEKIEKIISQDTKEALGLFNAANTEQKNFVCMILIGRIRDSQDVDLNLVDKISRAAGIDIQKQGEEAKFYSQKS